MLEFDRREGVHYRQRPGVQAQQAQSGVIERLAHPAQAWAVRQATA